MFGFLVEIEVDDGLAADESDALWRDFMALVEERGLLADGGTGGRTWTYRIHSEGSQATDGDRKAIEAWARARPAIVSASVGELFDIEVRLT